MLDGDKNSSFPNTVSSFFRRERRINQKARAAITPQPVTGPTTAPAIQVLLPELSEPGAVSPEEAGVGATDVRGVAVGVNGVTDVLGVAVAGSIHQVLVNIFNLDSI